MARRNRNGKKKVSVVVSTAPTRKTIKRRRARARRGLGSKLSVPRSVIKAVQPHGWEFLQCAVSPVDFPGTKAGGVPDLYSGPSFVMRHKAVFSVTITSSNAYTMLFAPSPGVAYYSNNGVVTQASTVNANMFPDAASFFGDSTSQASEYGTQNVSAYRIIGHSFEIKPVSATLNNAGMITAARCPGINMVHAVNTSEQDLTRISGLQSLTSTSLSTLPGAFVGHINQGIYGWAINDSGDWARSDLWYNTHNIKSTDGTGGELDAVAPATITGWGNTTPIGVTITGSNTNTSFALMVEQCVEYFPRAGSMMAEMASPSPPHDPAALELYQLAGRKMPAFVPADKNDGFWDKFLGLISSVAGALGAIPTPFAPILTGVSGVASGIRSLII